MKGINLGSNAQVRRTMTEGVEKRRELCHIKMSENPRGKRGNNNKQKIKRTDNGVGSEGFHSMQVDVRLEYVPYISMVHFHFASPSRSVG